ncbi:hypothetical protein CYMTET_45047, partial [Cymbomonas tetramitiformis]
SVSNGMGNIGLGLLFLSLAFCHLALWTAKSIYKFGLYGTVGFLGTLSSAKPQRRKSVYVTEKRRSILKERKRQSMLMSEDSPGRLSESASKADVNVEKDEQLKWSGTEESVKRASIIMMEYEDVGNAGQTGEICPGKHEPELQILTTTLTLRSIYPVSSECTAHACGLVEQGC